MKLINTIIFALGTGFFLIALHQHMTVGFMHSYWIYMLSIGLLLWYKMRRDSAKKNETN